jgi:DNA-directed RNA polymerase subunit F
MNVLSERIITDVETRQILEKKEKDAELKPLQKNSVDVLKKFAKKDPEDIKKLVEQLTAMGKLRDKQIISIANFLPEDKDDLRAILHKEYSALSPEDADNILKIVKDTI